jgi:hypothetical protein
MIDQDDQDNPFSAFTDSAAIMAFVHATHGEIALKKLLEAIDTDRETLSRDAEVLAALGLLKASDIVTAAADTALPERELLCPYDESDRNNYDCWRAAYDRRQLRSVADTALQDLSALQS